MRSMNFDHLKLPYCEFQNYEVMAMSVVGGQPKTNANPRLYMNQSQFQAITCNSREAREKSRVHGAIGLGFASHWLRNCLLSQPLSVAIAIT